MRLRTSTRVSRQSIVGFSIVLLAVAGSIAAGIAVAQSDNNGDGTYVPGFGVTLPPEKAKAAEATLPSGEPEGTQTTAPPTGAPDQIEANISSAKGAAIPFSPELIVPSNLWMVSDGKSLVAVYAGAAGDNSADGRLAIMTQSFSEGGGQTIQFIDVPKVGALEITKAPDSGSDETADQTADIGFTDSLGGSGTLHLATDTVSGEQAGPAVSAPR